MTKSELLKRINSINNSLSDTENELENLLGSLRKTIQDLEYLPDEVKDIEDDEKE